ncbi:hypothetical protein [Culicoidibacter larvae]|uniref:hypothetical protein n=1 Tax=Culicoidibacter larvae TaxID=2579976 RepID=UPI0014859F91|nr:hypothetical protein [Culicoidibacter larvae]
MVVLKTGKKTIKFNYNSFASDVARAVKRTTSVLAVGALVLSGVFMATFAFICLLAL